MYEELCLNNKQFTIPWFPALSKVTKHNPVEMMSVSHGYLTCRHFTQGLRRQTLILCVHVHVSQRTCEDLRTSLHVNLHLAPCWKWGLFMFTPAQTRQDACKTPEILLPRPSISGVMDKLHPYYTGLYMHSGALSQALMPGWEALPLYLTEPYSFVWRWQPSTGSANV